MTQSEFVGIIIGSIIGLVLFVIITRAIFSIEKITSNLEKQTKLLQEIMEKLYNVKAP